MDTLVQFCIDYAAVTVILGLGTLGLWAMVAALRLLLIRRRR